MKKQNVSDAVIRRLPRYYRYLNDLHSKGIVRISSSSLREYSVPSSVGREI